MSNTINTGSTEPEKKSSRKWYVRGIALILIIAMVVTTALSNQSTVSIEDMNQASFSEEGEEVVLDQTSIMERMEAIEEVKKLQKELNEEYSECMTLLGEGKYEEAIPALEHLLEYIDDSDDAGAYLRATLAELYYTTGDYASCAKSCDILAENGADTQGSYRFMAGVSRMQTGDYEKAIENLQGAIDAGYSDAAMVKTQLALAYVYNGDFTSAGTLCQEVLAGEHDESLNEVLYYISAIDQLQQGAYEEAEKELTEAIALNPQSEYLYYRGVAEMALEDYTTATADFKAALDAGYDETACWYNYGICALMADDLETAMSALQTVLERGDSEEYTASAQEMMDQINQAIEEAAAEQAGETTEAQ